jgi:stearoyl-CoA desaturase (Delta-9 desaturase)
MVGLSRLVESSGANVFVLWQRRRPKCRRILSEDNVLTIILFFLAHWCLSVFFQSFFHHRYCAHRMYTMSKGWERFFYLCTFVFQGSSFLSTRTYAILHREHHAFSDTERDPHSPHLHPTLWSMMDHTKNRYRNIDMRKVQPEPRFEGGYPQWPTIDTLGERWTVRGLFALSYVGFYVAFAPHWAWGLLLPIHFMMGPVHGAIVNWCGHKYGYRNFDTPDKSRNTLPFDLVTAGELFQNNHHKHGSSPNFAQRRWELDPTYQVMRLFHLIGIITLPKHSRPVVVPEPSLGDALSSLARAGRSRPS